MKCERCGEEINLLLFSKPKGICYGCLTPEEKDAIVEKNIEVKKMEQNN